VTIEGCQLVDDGVTANTPMLAETLGATEIYVLGAAEPVQPQEARPGALNVARHALNHLLDSENTAPQTARVPVLPAALSPTGNVLDFRHSVRLISESYRLTRRWLDCPLRDPGLGRRVSVNGQHAFHPARRPNRRPDTVEYHMASATR
jgi:hypothetical protein